MQKRGFFFVILLLSLGAGCRSSSLPATSTLSSFTPPANSVVTFSLNMQDFAYPDQSVATLNRVLDLHEKYHIPVDVFLTGTIARYYVEHAPDLVTRLKTSPEVAVSYHERPPAPYCDGFDWFGITSMSAEQQYNEVMLYETHDIDLSSGKTTNDAGGYDYVKSMMGYAPYAAGVPSGAGVTSAVDAVLVALGAKMDIVHGSSAMNIGEKKNGLFIRPETVDLKLFEHTESGAVALDSALASAPAVTGAVAPYFVNVKMHDNDFFATASAWTTVYLAQGYHRKPPFNLSLIAPLLSTADSDAVWTRYEQTLIEANALRSSITLMNIPDILALEE